MGEEKPNYAGMNKDRKLVAIGTATSIAELDAMWAAWERIGHSRDGLLYAAVLERKAALGHELTEEEAAQIKLAHARIEKGRRLPPITGRVSAR